MLLALVMVFALCACGSNGDKAAANNNGDYHLVLKLSHVFAPTEQLTIEMQQVAQRIKERTNGAIEIQCYDSSQLAVYKDNIVEGSNVRIRFTPAKTPPTSPTTTSTLKPSSAP